MGKIDFLFYDVLCNWNRKKSFRNFLDLYNGGFDNNAFFGFRVWRIIRNTLNGRYKDIERQVHEGKILIK